MTDLLECRWTVVGDLKIHARVSPDVKAGEPRPVVVLVHGLGVSSRYMVPLALRLARHCRVFAPDLPGFGRSSQPPHALDLPALADILAAWTQVLEIERAVFIGHSFGAQIVVNFAVRHPEFIERAVLVGPTIDAHRRTMRQQAGRLLLDALREPFSLIPLALRDYVRAGLRRTLQTLRYALQDRTEEKLSHLKVPTLVIRGERDPIAPQRWTQTMVQLIPGSRLLVIPAAAHAVNYSAPQELGRVVLAFLKE